MSAPAGALVIVTGMTGAGRSTAAKELEDLGYFVVDNLPPQLVGEVVRLVDEQHGYGFPVAAVVDVRGGVFFESLRAQLAGPLQGRKTTLLYLDATDDVLVRRQEAARRPHPLQDGGRLLEAIHREREVMAPLLGDAGLVIDTTKLNIHQLKKRVAGAFGSPESTALQITVLSFGFKYGVPVDADLLADMRFLPNPFWEPELRPLTGLDEPVSTYVLERPESQEFLDRFVPVVQTLTDGYEREGKRFMTVGIGCTGGKHRSVAMTEELASRLSDLGFRTRTVHRDRGKE